MGGSPSWLREFSWDNREGDGRHRDKPREAPGTERGSETGTEGQEIESRRVRDGKRCTR